MECEEGRGRREEMEDGNKRIKNEGLEVKKKKKKEEEEEEEEKKEEE